MQRAARALVAAACSIDAVARAGASIVTALFEKNLEGRNINDCTVRAVGRAWIGFRKSP